MRYFKKVVGENVYLSPINTGDGELYVKWLNDRAVGGNLGNFARMISLFGEEKALERLAEGEGSFAMVRAKDDVLIGNISLMSIDHISRTATLGIFIGEAENRGQGYGGEAIRLILDYGFHTLNLHNIMLTVHSDNAAGIRCYEKVGFREFGRRKECKFKDGEYIDIIYMEILDSGFYGAKE